MSACKSVIAAEPAITQSDRIVGDGDCGTTLSRGANAVLDALSKSPLSETTSASSAVLRIANAVEESMDGTSGALYELFMTALVAELQASQETEANTRVWAQAASGALNRLEAMTPARVGDRTIMDALIPFVQTLTGGSLSQAVNAAKAGCEKTRGMEASLGRAVYVTSENWGKVADPGAEGIVAIVEGLALGLKVAPTKI